MQEFAPFKGGDQIHSYFSPMAAIHKTNQYLLALGKVLVVVVTFGYIFYRLAHNPDLDFLGFVHNIYGKGRSYTFLPFVFLFLAALNWYFEILKWQHLVSSIEKVDFQVALKQSLAALAFSLATPNRIGDYGAKALFFERENRKWILLLNLFSNLAQMGVTLLFGIIGVIYFILNFEATYFYGAFSLLGTGLLLIGMILYFLRSKELFLKGLSMVNIIRHFLELPISLRFKIGMF